ncbi:MAG: response regulator transcription factor [Lachnospiraceae bacterium]|jgi:DNA-binding LytR/AlgR family response regulator|nr:response regulator transcription factor [Lachnospiraceae bacterium]
MYRFAVCDDSSADRAYVTALIEAWGCSRDILLQIEDYPSAEAFLFAYEGNETVDVLFLDIEMGDMSGVELAKRLRQMGAGLQIVFLTGYMEYIAEGYDVEALHYLIKPVAQEKLGAVLDRAVERLKTRENVLLLSLPDGVVRLPLYEIRYLEVMKNYVTLHAVEEYSVKRSLSELTKELDESFYRIHRSYIVNLRFVKRITRTEVTLKDGAALPLSRKLYDGLNQALIKYF